jgi:hypothetical protein
MPAGTLVQLSGESPSLYRSVSISEYPACFPPLCVFLPLSLGVSYLSFPLPTSLCLALCLSPYVILSAEVQLSTVIDAYLCGKDDFILRKVFLGLLKQLPELICLSCFFGQLPLQLSGYTRGAQLTRIRSDDLITLGCLEGRGRDFS